MKRVYGGVAWVLSLCLFGSAWAGEEHGHAMTAVTHDEHDQAQVHEDAHEEGVLMLNAEQIEALGLRFAALEPVSAVQGYAWPAFVDIPLAHRDMVTAPVAGRIARIHVVHGEVKAGQPVIELESAELVRMQQAYLDALAQFEAARKNFTRAQRLYKAGSQSEKQFLAAKTAWTVARARRQAAYDALIYAGLSEAQIRQAVQRGELVRTLVLKAPRDGLLFDLQVERNQRVAADTLLAHVGEIDEVVVDVDLPVRELDRVRVGQTAALAGLPLKGRVAYVSGQADPDTQRVRVHILFDNAARTLLPGQFVRVHFVQEVKGKRHYRVPSRAVVDMEGMPAIFLRQGERIEPVPVELVDRDGRWAIVALAEQPDESARVVSFGAVFLKGMMEGEGEGGAGHAH